MGLMGLKRNETVMVAVLLAGTLLAVLNQTLLSPALPAIMADLQVDATTVQWLTSGYSLVEAVIIPLSAFLIGRFSTRQLFLTGFGLFTAGSLLAALAPGFGFLLAGRVLQAACTGMVMPMVTTVILLVFPREKRGSAMGTIGLVIGFAPAVGPSVAGLLVDSVGWRVLFGVVTVLSVAVLVLGSFFLKNYGSFDRTRFDAPSVVLSTLGLVCVLYGLSTFSSSSNIALTVALIVVGTLLVALYVRRQLSLDEPMLNVGILRTRKYAVAVIVIVLIEAALMGTGVITPLYIQGVRGYSATMSGVAMLPGAVLGAALGLVAGRLFDRYGVRRVAIPGFVVTLAGAGGLVLLGMDSDIVVIALTYTLLSAGLQFAMTPVNTWGLNSLDNKVLQHAQGLSNTMNQVAASFGTALLVSVSAFGPRLAPGASALEQTYLGDHLAYCVTAALMVVAFAIICVFVRDGVAKRAEAGRPAGRSGREEGRSGQVAEQRDAARAGSLGAPAGVAHVGMAAAESAALQSAVLAAMDMRDLRVEHAMTTDPSYVTVDAEMRDVIRVMAATDTSGVPVVDDSLRVKGFVSDGDVASYLGSSDSSLFDATLNLYRFPDDGDVAERLSNMLGLNVMRLATQRVVAVESQCPLDKACRMLAEKRIKKVPVVDNGVLVGSLSRRNIVRIIAASVEAGQAENGEAAKS